MLLHSAETGELMAVINGSAITAIRTAAVSGLATNLLARDDAKEVAIIGTGVQGRMHLQAMAAIGGFERARVCSRRRENAEAFAKELGPKMPFTIEPVDDVKSAVEYSATRLQDPARGPPSPHEKDGLIRPPTCPRNRDRYNTISEPFLN